MVQCVDLAQIDMILSLNQMFCGLLMLCRVIKNGLDGVGSTTQTVVDHLSGVRKSVGDQLCLVGMLGGEIW